MVAEWMIKGKPSMLGAASGAVAGLVAITPAAGNVGIPGAFVIGTGAGVVCLWGVTGLKKLIRADDSLDVFGVHAVGGDLRRPHDRHLQCALPGRPGLGRLRHRGADLPRCVTQFRIQLKAVCLVVAWTATVAFLAASHTVKALLGCGCRKRRSARDLTSPPTASGPTT